MAAGLLSVLITGSGLLTPGQPAVAAINRQVNFQGKVVNLNGTNVTDGNYSFTFSIYTVASGGSPVWTETKTLAVADGVFQTNLGDVTSLPGSVDFNNSGLYLGINFNSDGEMSPRIRFTAAAYAFNADAVDGLDSTQLARTDANNTFTGTQLVKSNANGALQIQNAAGSTTLLNFDASTTRLGIGVPSPSYALDVAGDINTSVSLKVAGVSVCTTTGGGTCTPASGSGYYVQNGTTVQTANAAIQSASDSSVTLLLKNRATQSADIFRVVNNADALIFNIDTFGGAELAGNLTVDNVAAIGGPSDTGISLKLYTASDSQIGLSVNAVGAGHTGDLAQFNGPAGRSLIYAASGNLTVTGGNVVASGAVVAPVVRTADPASGASADLAIRSGNAGSGNSNSGNVTLDAGTKNGSGFGGNMYLGTANAASVNIGRSSSPNQLSIQGVASSTNLVFHNAAGTFSTTVAVTTPTANSVVTIPNETGTVCTSASGSTTCSGNYILNQTAAPQTGGFYVSTTGRTGGNLTVGGSLLTGSTVRLDNAGNLSNIGTIGATGAVTISGTGANELAVTGAPAASGVSSLVQLGAVLSGASANGTYLGVNAGGGSTADFLHFQTNGTSKLSVTSAGNLVQAAGATVNGQTITSAAQFTGTLQVASAFTVSAGGASITGGLDNNSDGITGAGAVSGATTITGSGTITGGGAFKSADGATSSAVSLKSGDASGGASGAVTVDSGSATTTAGVLNIGTTNASAVTVGRNGSGSPNVLVQGGSESSIQVNNGANYSLIQFASPTAQVTYTLGTNGSNTSAAICTSLAPSCNTTYQPYNAGGYLKKGQTASEQSIANVSGAYAYDLQNGSGTAAGVLSLSNSGTNSALLVTAASNPTANQAVITAVNSNGTPTGNLLDLRVTAGSQFSVDTSGNVTTNVSATTGLINGQRISSSANFTGTVTSAQNVTVSSGGITVTGTGTFNNAATVTGLLTANGGASVTGGINNNAGGITGAGAVTDLTSLQFNTAGTIDANAAVSLSIGTTNASAVNVGRAGGTLSLQGNTSSTLVSSNGTNTITVGFANPSANSIYQFANGGGSTYQICSTYASTCGTTYAAYYAAGYIQLAPGSAQADANANASVFINKTAGTTLVNLQASGSTVFQVQTSGTAYLGGTSSSHVMQVDTTNFKVRIGTGTPTLGSGGANATAALYVSGSAEFAGTIRVGDATNNTTYDATTKEVTYNGTARHASAVRLVPEFAGAVLDADGANNTGTMTAAYESTQRFGYYKWVTSQGTAQDYDVVLTLPVPDDFSAWTGTPTFWNYGNASSTMTVTITDTAGTVATNYNAATLTTSTTWTARSVGTPAITGTYTQGSNMIVRIHMTAAATTGDVRLGPITLPYLKRW